VNTNEAAGFGLLRQKSYFIDTILKDFPFPKVYFHEKVEKETKTPRREIVDGQQRIGTIVDFVDGKITLGKERQRVPRAEIRPTNRGPAGSLLLVHGLCGCHSERRQV